MKRYITLFIALSVLAFTAISFIPQDDNTEVSDSCNAPELKKKCKDLLDDFQYDAAKITKVSFKDKPQVKELEVPLFMGERYRFVFSKEGLPQDADIEVWDNKFESKKRTLLFTTKNFPEDQVEFVWEPEKSRTMYLTYKVPPTTDVEKKGCFFFMIGYHVKGSKK
jgi:hypothetical protein